MKIRHKIIILLGLSYIFIEQPQTLRWFAAVAILFLAIDILYDTVAAIAKVVLPHIRNLTNQFAAWYNIYVR